LHDYIIALVLHWCYPPEHTGLTRIIDTCAGPQQSETLGFWRPQISKNQQISKLGYRQCSHTAVYLQERKSIFCAKV